MDKEKYLSYVRAEILDQIKELKESGKLISKNDLPKRMNSYERNLYLPLMDTDLLI